MPDSPPLSHMDKDVVAIKNLQLPFGVIAPDVWGKSKEQPALVSLHLILRHGFTSASKGDALDASTIHYGQLAKLIRSKSFANQTAGAVSSAVEEAVQELAGKVTGKFLVEKCTITVKLPKATMYAEDGLSLVNALSFDDHGKVRVPVERALVVERCRLMTLIGVNGYERTGKQPVEASVWLSLPVQSSGGENSQGMVALFNIDQTLAQIVQDTSFETLETLASFTVDRMKRQLLNSVIPGGSVQLKLAKPQAIAWADAPYVEVLRRIPISRPADTHASRPSTAQASLHSQSASTLAQSVASNLDKKVLPQSDHVTRTLPPSQEEESAQTLAVDEDPAISSSKESSNSIENSISQLRVLKPYNNNLLDDKTGKP